MPHTFTRTGAQIEEIHNTVDDLPNIVSNENLISNASFDNAGSVTNPPDATPRSYNAGDELFQGMFAVGALTGVTYIDGKANGTGQLYTDVYKSEKQNLSTANYVASIANSNGSPVEIGASFVDIGDYWRVTFDMSETFSVKFEQGSVATRHEVEYGVVATGSTTARTLGDRFADVVNVKDFGAVGDGVTDDTAAIQAALQTSKYVVGDPNDNYAVSGKISITLDDVTFDGRGCKFTWIGSTQVGKLDAPMSIAGSGNATVTTTVTADIGSYHTDIPVTDSSGFSAGDYGVFNYSVRQGDGVTQPPIACNVFGDREYIFQIVEVSGNTITIDRPRAFAMYVAPPAGGGLEFIKVEVVKGVTVKNYTYTQERPTDLIWNSAVSIEYGVDCTVDNVNCYEISGIGLSSHYAHTLRVSNCNYRDATYTGGGQGYGIQLAEGNSYVYIDKVRGSGLRHLVDISGSSAYVNVTSVFGSECGPCLGMHGGFEHDVLFHGCKVSNGGYGIYLGTNGDAFGNKCKNIQIVDHVSEFVDRGIYGGIGTQTRPENITVRNYWSQRDADGGSTNYDIACVSDNFTVMDSHVHGGIWVSDNYATTVSDVSISNTTLEPFGTPALSMDVDTIPFVVYLDGCVIKGNIDMNEDTSLVLDGCVIHTEKLFTEVTDVFESVTINGCTINIEADFMNTLSTRDWQFTNNTSNMNGFNAQFYIDGGSANVSRLVVDSNKGDITHFLRRGNSVQVTNNQQLDGADVYFGITQSSDAKVIVSNNTLKKTSTDAYCIDFGSYSSPDQNGQEWVVMGNLHNGPLRLTSTTGSIQKMAAIGNVISPDVGDTITQASVTPSSSAGIVIESNVGWS